VILDQDSVEEDCGIGGSLEGAVCVEGWRCPDDVVGLPLTGFARGVREWDALLVDAAGLAVDVGFVVVVVEDLEFVSVVSGAGGGEKDAAVAACLIGAGDVLGDSPLDVELMLPTPVALLTVRMLSATVHLAGDLSLVVTHWSRFLPSKRTIASEGGAESVAPGVMIGGTGS